MLRMDPRYEFLPIIVLTSHRNSDMRQAAILSGADDFINYPLNRLELITRIRSLLRIKEYHADLEQTQNVICALALALEAKDRYTRGHSQRVGLRGDDIPCEVRLLSIVDAYDALTSHHAYRPAPLEHSAAMETLRREAAGGKWDPEMVSNFSAMLGDGSPQWESISLPVPVL